MPLHFHVISVLQNGHNGHYSVRCRIVETNDKDEEIATGPTEVQGIAAEAIERRYGPSTDLDSAVQQWLDEVEKDMVRKYRTDRKVCNLLNKHSGTRRPCKHHD